MHHLLHDGDLSVVMCFEDAFLKCTCTDWNIGYRPAALRHRALVV